MICPFVFGEDIPLSIFLLKNDKPLSGEIVAVRVINETTQLELLASTPVPESSEPGEYTFLWTVAPELELNLLAIFTIGTGGNAKTSTEFFKIREAIDDSAIAPCDVLIQTVQDDVVKIVAVENQVVAVNVFNEPIIEIDVIQNEVVQIKTTQAVVDVLVDCG